jgi:hypothetical protein
MGCGGKALRDIGSRVRKSGVETSAAHSQNFNLGFCPLPCKNPVEQQRGVVRIMLNDIEGMRRKYYRRASIFEPPTQVAL